MSKKQKKNHNKETKKVVSVVVAEYIAARNEYEAAIAKPNSHAPARTLPHGSPTLLWYRDARTALYALPKEPT